MSQALLQAVTERFGAHIIETHAHAGDETVVLRREGLLDVCAYLKASPALSIEQVIDVTAVDWMGRKEPRFEVVYHLYSLTKKHRLRLKVPVSEAEPRVPSLVGLWRGANWPERECFDMYGIEFEGHPDLRRLLTYDEFEGHPLRKDYPVRGYQPLEDMPSLPVEQPDPEE